LSAVETPNTKPAQTACRSKAAPWPMPKAAWICVAVAGNVWSGVEVAQITRSMSSPVSPASSSAA
jgi:hypothetical protein